MEKEKVEVFISTFIMFYILLHFWKTIFALIERLRISYPDYIKQMVLTYLCFISLFDLIYVVQMPHVLT